jgi:hypothetical protein
LLAVWAIRSASAARMTLRSNDAIRSEWAVEIQGAADRLRAPDGHYGNALGRKISATSHRERLRRNLVAHASTSTTARRNFISAF